MHSLCVQDQPDDSFAEMQKNPTTLHPHNHLARFTGRCTIDNLPQIQEIQMTPISLCVLV